MDGEGHVELSLNDGMGHMLALALCLRWSAGSWRSIFSLQLRSECWLHRKDSFWEARPTDQF